MKTNYNIFIGGGYIDSQILWLSKIISGYEAKPKNIILDQVFNKITMDDLKKTFPDTEIIIENNTFKNFLSKFFFFFFNFKKLLIFLYKIKKRKKSFTNTYENQILNSIWDTALVSMNDDQLKPNSNQILYAIFKSLYAVNRTKKIFNLYGINLVFLGHSVYGARAMLAYFRKKKIKIFCQAGFNVYDCSKHEAAWNQISISKFNLLEKKIKKKYIFLYWKKRLLGKSNYFDAKIASSIKNKIKDYPRNVIFLHIFKDSPFNFLDEKRIFYDYFDWIKKTLQILKYSNEKWSIRIHPNASRWGENQKKIINNLLVNSIELKNKILIDDNLVSNNFIFNNINRIVTYSGTSHLEASCFKIKPIMISKSSLECIDKNFVLKPKNIKEYKKFLLKKSTDKIFLQPNKVVNKSKTYLFIRENILSLKKDLNTINIYRQDKNSLINDDFKSVLKSINLNKNYLKFLGRNLRLNHSHTFSKSYYKYTNEKYSSF